MRVGKHKETEYEKLYTKWIETRHKDDEVNKALHKKLEEELANKYADNICDKIMEEIKGMNCDDGGINSNKLWKLKKKLHNSFYEPPTAMKDSDGKLLTRKEDILV